jgi:hypothetical protein
LNTLVALNASGASLTGDTLRSLDRAARNPLRPGGVVDPKRIVRLDNVGIALSRAGRQIGFRRNFALEVDAETGRALDTLLARRTGWTLRTRFALNTLDAGGTGFASRTGGADFASRTRSAGRTLVALRSADRNPGNAVVYENVLRVCHCHFLFLRTGYFPGLYVKPPESDGYAGRFPHGVAATGGSGLYFRRFPQAVFVTARVDV